MHQSEGEHPLLEDRTAMPPKIQKDLEGLGLSLEQIQDVWTDFLFLYARVRENENNQALPADPNLTEQSEAIVERRVQERDRDAAAFGATIHALRKKPSLAAIRDVYSAILNGVSDTLRRRGLGGDFFDETRLSETPEENIIVVQRHLEYATVQLEYLRAMGGTYCYEDRAAEEMDAQLQARQHEWAQRLKRIEYHQKGVPFPKPAQQSLPHEMVVSMVDEPPVEVSSALKKEGVSPQDIVAVWTAVQNAMPERCAMTDVVVDRDGSARQMQKFQVVMDAAKDHGRVMADFLRTSDPTTPQAVIKIMSEIFAMRLTEFGIFTRQTNPWRRDELCNLKGFVELCLVGVHVWLNCTKNQLGEKNPRAVEDIEQQAAPYLEMLESWRAWAQAKEQELHAQARRFLRKTVDEVSETPATNSAKDPRVN